MFERTTVRLPKVLLDRARKKAAERGITLTALLEESLLRNIEEGTPKKRQGQRISLPVSSATGGPRPGVDLTRMAGIYEDEDREYMERLRKGFQESSP